MASREEILGRYSFFLEACNRRSWREVRSCLAESVLVEGRRRSRREYTYGLEAQVAVYPDLRWELRQAVVVGDRLAVHLRTMETRPGPRRGAPGDGTVVQNDKIVVYRFADALIAEVTEGADDDSPR